jgi:spermidine synthase
LFASILFPLIFIPYLGLIRTSFLFGVLNVAVALVVCHLFAHELQRRRHLQWIAWVSLLFLLGGAIASEKIISLAESMMYQDAIVYARSSPYQRIVITRHKNDWRLFLNGNLQFSSNDEYRYHEALVHPAMTNHTAPKRILILGGGDGMAAREVLRYPSVESVDLVDLDAEMTQLFRNNPLLLRLNQNALQSPKVTIHNQDAFLWIKNQSTPFDLAVVDFPDPSNYSLGKLYTAAFYRQLYELLSPNGMAVIQATSPFVAKQSFWIIHETIRAAGFQTLPYHCHVPSFGEWGYILAYKQGALAEKVNPLPAGLRFFDESSLDIMSQFPPDMTVASSPVNRLNNQVLVNTFEKEWSLYSR